MKTKTPKIIKPRSFPIIIYALFLLALVGIVVGMCFVPYFGVGKTADAAKPLEQFTIIDMLTCKFLFSKSGECKLFEIISTNDAFGKYRLFYMIAFIVMAVIVAISFVIAFVQLITSLVLLIRGRSNNMGGGFTSAWFSMIASVIIAAFPFLLRHFTDKIYGEPLIGVTYAPVIFAGAQLLILIILGIINGVKFHNGVYLKEYEEMMERRKARQNAQAQPQYQTPVIQIVTNGTQATANSGIEKEPAPVTNSAAAASSLPRNLTKIGGHAFSENMDLEIADIPETIDTIGNGAFANCPKLREVTIPLSMKKIGYNAFFNCFSLKKIKYNGTKSEWRYIARGSNWLTKAGTTIVYCVDGPISVDPSK